MDKEAWWATAYRVTKELDTTKATEHAHTTNLKVKVVVIIVTTIS